MNVSETLYIKFLSDSIELFNNVRNLNNYHNMWFIIICSFNDRINKKVIGNAGKNSE